MRIKYTTNLLCLIILFIVIPAFSQNKKTETVFITSSEPREKKEKEKKELSPFIQMSLNMSVQVNPDNFDGDDEIEVSNFVIPNGLEAHFGYGYLYNSWLGLSVNTGTIHRYSKNLLLSLFMVCLP